MSKRFVAFTTHRAVTACLGLALGLAACKGDDAKTDEVGESSESGTTESSTSSSSSGMDTSTNDTVDTVDTSDDTSTDTTTDTSGAECGNGVIEAGEACDGGDIGGATCEGEGFASGNLSCADDCTLDTSTCSSCGDGVANDAEECDGADLGMFATCADVALGTPNEPLGCNADCTYDFAMCSGCGDGTITAPEDCEGADLGGQDCVSQGFTEGTLACTAGCAFDTTGCALCGDAVKEGTEACDGADFGALGCADFESPNMLPFDTGSLACDGACNIDTSNCSLCGDGVVTGNEVCEPSDLLGETCSSQGFTAGVLGCNDTCTGYDTSMCTTCGDGSVEGNEQCDGNDLAGESCVGLGHPGGGTLTCSNTCLFDTSQCVDEFCGDGLKNLADACDCGNQGVNCTAAQLGNQTCQTQGFAGGTLQCNSPMNCMFDTSQCYSCGDGVINPGEQCDGNNLAGQSCVTQGYNGGALSCNASCQLNLTGCTPTYAIGFCRLQFPTVINSAQGTNITVYGRLYVAGLTDQSVFNNPAAAVDAWVGYGPDGSNPAVAPGWVWIPAVPNPGWNGSLAGAPNDDEYQATLVVPAPGVYDYAYRFSGNSGGSFTYCDGDAPGNTNGYAPANAGQMTATP